MSLRFLKIPCSSFGKFFCSSSSNAISPSGLPNLLLIGAEVNNLEVPYPLNAKAVNFVSSLPNSLIGSSLLIIFMPVGTA